MKAKHPLNLECLFDYKMDFWFYSFHTCLIKISRKSLNGFCVLNLELFLVNLFLTFKVTVLKGYKAWKIDDSSDYKRGIWTRVNGENVSCYWMDYNFGWICVGW